MLVWMYIDMVRGPRQTRAGAAGRRAWNQVRAGHSGLGRTLDGCPYGKERMHEIARLETEIYGKILSSEAEEHVRDCRGALSWS